MDGKHRGTGSTSVAKCREGRRKEGKELVLQEEREKERVSDVRTEETRLDSAEAHEKVKCKVKCGE